MFILILLLKIGAIYAETFNGHPVYEIQIRPIDDSEGSTSQNILEANTIAFIKVHPYAKVRAEAFYYRKDVDMAANANKKPFLVSGFNCQDTIKDLVSITGVPIEILSLRARGNAPNRDGDVYTFAKVAQYRPEWYGVSLSRLRSSTEGFISRKYVYKKGESEADRTIAGSELKRLLLSDNQVVNSKNLTHQMVAEPILKALEIRMYNRKDELVFNARRFKITKISTGSSAKRNTYRDPVLQESGWIDGGQQGSFFNDELFMDWAYTFERLDPRDGEKLEFTIDGLTPHLIYRYGFYQGGPYRTEPEAIIEFFGIKADNPLPVCN